MQGKSNLNFPNLVSGLRLLTAIPAAYLIWQECWYSALIIWIIAACSDLFDGILARRLKKTTDFGKFLDHGADFIFVFSCMVALVKQDVITMALPILTALAFARYLALSKATGSGGSTLQSSQLGKINGVAYYCLCGLALVIQSAVNSDLLPVSFIQVVTIFSWLLVATTTFMIMQGYRQGIRQGIR